MNNYEFNTKSTYYVPPQVPKNRKILNMNKKIYHFYWSFLHRYLFLLILQ